MRKNIHNNVMQRVAANRQRAEQERQREEREAAAIKLLNQQTKKEN
jgi:hypothetical protein